jgi:hypothetical protein
MPIICEKCQTRARHTNLNGYGVCYAPKTAPCDRYVTEEELDQEVQAFYNKQGTFTGD